MVIGKVEEIEVGEISKVLEYEIIVMEESIVIGENMIY